MPAHDLTATAPSPALTPSPANDPVPDAALVAHIVERHHGYARRALPYMVALLAKVAGSHGRRNAKLGVLCDTGQELSDALEAHLEDEERFLFPALLAGTSAAEAIRRGLDRMSQRHRELSLLLARVRWLADDFAVPAWGGRSYQVLMEELEALEQDLLQHVHLESAILAPRLRSRCAGAC